MFLLPTSFGPMKKSNPSKKSLTHLMSAKNMISKLQGRTRRMWLNLFMTNEKYSSSKSPSAKQYTSSRAGCLAAHIPLRVSIFSWLLDILTLASGCFLSAFNSILLPNLNHTLLWVPVKPNHPCSMNSAPLNRNQASVKPRDAAQVMILLGPLLCEDGFFSLQKVLPSESPVHGL